MKYSNPKQSSCDKEIETQQTQPTKRFNSFQIQNRLKDNAMSMMNTSRNMETIACAFHPDQKITNFCKNKQCLLPLCPKCVGIHCQQHSKMGIFGNFVTIDDSMAYVSESLKEIFNKLDNFDKTIQNGKQEVQSKKNRLSANLCQAKHKFVQKIMALIQNFEQAINNICQIQENACEEQLKRSQQTNNILFQVYNSCLKKLMNPSQRLQGMIDYFYHEDAFKSIDQMQQKMQNFISRPQIVILLNQAKTSTFQSVLNTCFIISNLQRQIWSQYKILNHRFSNSKIQQNQHHVINYPRLIETQTKLNSSECINLDNFVSPLEQFNLQHIRSQRLSRLC